MESSMIPELRFPQFDGEWKKEKLKNVSTYFNGGSFENDVNEEGKYELVTLKSIDTSGNLVHSERFIDIETPTLSKDTLVMILSEQAPGLLGMTALIPIDNKYVLNQRVAEIRPNDNVESYFLSMVINRNQRYFSKHGAGTKVQNISKPNVVNYDFLLPTLSEQAKIANFLTAVDKRITLLQKKKAELTQYKKGVMQKIFSQEIRFKQDDGGDFPDWEEKKLGEVAIKVGSGKTPRGGDKIYSKQGIHFIRSQNVINNRLILDETHISDTIHSEMKGSKVIANDILLNITGGSIGRSCVVPSDFIEGNVNQHVSIIRLKEDNPKFLQPLLSSWRGQKLVFQGMTGSGREGLNFESIKGFKINIPALPEQTKIANFLLSIDKSIGKLNNQIEQSQKWKKGLLQRMFV